MRARHVVAVATVAAIAAGAGTAVGQSTQGPPSGTLEFTVKATRDASRSGFNPAVPRDKKRPKVADLGADNVDLLMDGKLVGRGHHFELTTYEGPRARKYRGKAVAIAGAAADFGNGDVLFLSCLAEDSPTDNHCAVTGGTGRYAGARGSAVELFSRGKETKRTFTFPVRVTFMP